MSVDANKILQLQDELYELDEAPEMIVARASKVPLYRVGSCEYLIARYGRRTYDFISKYVYKCAYSSRKNEIMAERYSPIDTDWKISECKELEALLSSEEKQRAVYEPKCRPLIEFIDGLKAEQQAEEAKQQEEQCLRDRVDTIRSTKRGSTEYIIARYGEHAYRLMLDTVIKDLNVLEENAAAYLIGSYSEDMWRAWEDDAIEKLLGNR